MGNSREYYEWLKMYNWINNEMFIDNFNMFLNDAKYLKKMYKELTPLGVKLYKLYIYAQRDLSLKRVNAIWNYLNDDITYEDLMKY